MSESFLGGGDQARRPPSPDQYRTIQDRIRELSPDSSSTWKYIDDEGVQHVVLIKNFETRPHEDEPDLVGFINHADIRRPIAPTMYYLEADPLAASREGVHLRVEVFDRSDMFGGLAEQAAQAIQKQQAAEIAEELGADAASAAEAQHLISVLGAVAERGVLHGVTPPSQQA
jgi:hypothetical protein